VTLCARALVLADEHNLPAVYDVHYVFPGRVARADALGGRPAVAAALGGQLPFVRWISDYGT
jgi:hypothetical protein